MSLDCNEILKDRLWVGCYVRLEDVPDLEDLAITSVVNLQSDEDISYYQIPLDDIVEAYRSHNIAFRRAATPDFDREALARNLSNCVDQISHALSPSNARVYLHCTAGINRAPTVAGAYLIRSEGLSAREAYQLLTSRRQCSPYLGVLEEYAQSLGRKP